MNIHFEDKILFDKLKNASLAVAEFGSILYKTNDKNSDIDLHYIYATSDNELNSFLKSHHHLQYNEEGVDHIFVNLHTFLRNTINGDSSVLFEIIHSGQFIGTPLEFLYQMRNAFNNYSIIRSYCGFCKRDCEHYHKKKTHREQLKALSHIHRGYYFAKSIMEGNFRLIDEEFLEVYKVIKNIKENDFKFKKQFLELGKININNLREELNNKFNNHTLGLPKYMTTENQKLLDENINKLMFTENYYNRNSFLKHFDMNIFYNAFENEINYQM
jgi:hypothetical protein